MGAHIGVSKRSVQRTALYRGKSRKSIGARGERGCASAVYRRIGRGRSELYPRPLCTCASYIPLCGELCDTVTPSLMPAATNIVRYRVERGLEGVVAASW